MSTSLCPDDELVRKSFRKKHPFSDEFLQVYLFGRRLILSNPKNTLNLELERETVSALMSWIRVSSAALIPRLHGVGTNAYSLGNWKYYISIALRSLKEISKKNLVDVKVSLMALEASMFSVITDGFMKSVFSGALFELWRQMEACSNLNYGRESGLVHSLIASFYLSAPWPLRSYKRARASAETALLMDPCSQRNCYLYGLALFRLKRLSEASEVLKSAFELSATSEDENDLAPLLKGEIRKVFAQCKRDMKQRSSSRLS